MSSKLVLRLIIAAVILIVFSVFVGVERIDAGNVGLKVNMTGGNQGISHTEYATGWCFYWKLTQKVYEFPTFQQHKQYEPYQVPTKGGTIFTVHPTFNYNLNPGEVANMFQRYRLGLSQLEDGYLNTSMTIAIREITNTFTVDSILNNQSGYDAAILNKLNKELHPYFQITQFSANLTPDDRLKEAIVNKAKAIQEAQASLAQVAVAEANAKVDITNARKDSAVLVINAEGKAREITLQQEALKQSPQYIELIKAQKWDGALPQYMLGSGSSTLLNLK